MCSRCVMFYYSAAHILIFQFAVSNRDPYWTARISGPACIAAVVVFPNVKVCECTSQLFKVQCICELPFACRGMWHTHCYPFYMGPLCLSLPLYEQIIRRTLLSFLSTLIDLHVALFVTICLVDFTLCNYFLWKTTVCRNKLRAAYVVGGSYK